jgi:AcrR family transcriptional regulator
VAPESERTRRPGGRSARVRRAVLDATIGLLVERGGEPFTVADVAARAGVHESTIYRRWGTPAGLFMDAALDNIAAVMPVPDTGSLRGDLVALASAVVERRASPLGATLLRMSLVPDDDPRSDEYRLAYWKEQRDRTAVIVERAVERGEVRADVPPGMVLELVIAPLYTRALATGGLDEPGLAEKIVDLVLAGVRP